MSRPDIETKLREALDGVTPGPWELVSLSGYGSPFSIRMAYTSSSPNAPKTHYGVQSVRTREDAAYITLCSPDNIGALLDTIASLRSKLEEAEGARGSALVATPPAEPVVEAQIKHMVQRFLQWKLPENFNPDGGIGFDKSYRSPHGPVGTNLFDAMQADAMVRHMLDGLPALATKPAVKDDEKAVETMPLREIRRRVRNIWGAISSNQVIDKDVEGQAKRLLADIDVALAAKDGRS